MATTPRPAFPSIPVEQALDDVCIVKDGQKDIAINQYDRHMIVGIDNRVKLQKIWVRKGPNGDGKTTTRYDSDEEAPPDDDPMNLLATAEELNEDNENSLRVLVVGFVIAKNPSEFSNKGTGTKSKQKSSSGPRILPCKQNILRVVMEVTEEIAVQAKYYVAYNRENGLCDLRVIGADQVFFFEEILSDITHTTNIVERRRVFAQKCKELAARTNNKRPGKAESTLSRDDQIIEVVVKLNHLHQQFSLWTSNKTTDGVKAFEQALARILPDLAKMPSNNGIAAFYSFDNGFGEAEAGDLIHEVNVSNVTGLYVCSSNLAIVSLPQHV